MNLPASLGGAEEESALQRPHRLEGRHPALRGLLALAGGQAAKLPGPSRRRAAGASLSSAPRWRRRRPGPSLGSRSPAVRKGSSSGCSGALPPGGIPTAPPLPSRPLLDISSDILTFGGRCALTSSASAAAALASDCRQSRAGRSTHRGPGFFLLHLGAVVSCATGGAAGYP